MSGGRGMMSTFVWPQLVPPEPVIPTSPPLPEESPPVLPPERPTPPVPPERPTPPVPDPLPPEPEIWRAEPGLNPQPPDAAAEASKTKMTPNQRISRPPTGNEHAARL